MPVVTLTGPRQSGKTFLARATFPKHAYVSLEDPDERSRAATDPRGFLFLMDLGDRLVPVEVKYGHTVAADATDNLIWWTNLARSRDGVVIHGGTAAHSLHGISVRPWFIA
jgi:hypothetical protein